MSDNIPLNFALLKEWPNWLIVTLMVTIFALGLSLIFHETPSAT